MVHCPQCGAENPDDSQICSECGAALPDGSRGLRCPMCSHLNPAGRESCERCNARLVPLVASSQEPSETSPDDSPVPGPFSVEDEEIVPERGGREPSLDQGDPDWLRRMRADVFSEQEDEPEMQSGAEPEEPPDWLSRLAPSTATPPQEPASGAEVPPETSAPPEDEAPAWLRRLESPVEETPEAEDVPAWLADMMPSGGEVDAEGVVASLPPDEEVPGWLADLLSAESEGDGEESTPGGSMVSARQEEPTPAPEEGEEVPDWLAQMAPDEERAEEEEPVPATEEEGEVPDWLAELAPDEETPAVPTGEGEEVPDWLAQMAAGEEGAEEEEPVPATEEEGEVPDWLGELAPDEETPVVPTEEGEEVPDWLAQMAPDEERAEEEEPVPAAEEEGEVPDWLIRDTSETPPIVEAEVPDWLSAMAPTDQLPPELSRQADDLDLTFAEQVDVPDWLRSAPSTEEELPPAVAPREEDLAQAEIPVWLQAMRPGVAPEPSAVEEERDVETQGLLAGIAGVTQPAAFVGPRAAARLQPESVSTEATLARARLWQQMIARTAQPTPRTVAQPGTRTARDYIVRWLIYGIVLLAVLVPVVGDVDLSGFLTLGTPLTKEAGAAYDFVDQLVSDGSSVLVAFDYDPSYIGELQTQAEAFLQHLSRKNARVIVLSLRPEGAGLAQSLLNDVLDPQGYVVGQDYVNLGYLPGESVGIRSLQFLPGQLPNQAFDGVDIGGILTLPGGETMALGDMDLVMVLTSSPNNMRWWVEQIALLEYDLGDELPLVAGVSAAIEPLVRPYYDMNSPQIDGLVAGLAGAVDYELKLDNVNGPAHTRIEGQLVGQVAVFVLILVGMIAYSVSRQNDTAV